MPINCLKGHISIGMSPIGQNQGLHVREREREREREKWLIKRGVQCMEFCHLELEKLNIEK